METRGCTFIYPMNDLRCVLLRDHKDPHLLSLQEAIDANQVIAPWAMDVYMRERRCSCGWMLASFGGFVTQVCRCGRRYEVTVDQYKLLARIDELEENLKYTRT
jgi:hypothetical protein